MRKIFWLKPKSPAHMCAGDFELVWTARIEKQQGEQQLFPHSRGVPIGRKERLDFMQPGPQGVAVDKQGGSRLGDGPTENKIGVERFQQMAIFLLVCVGQLTDEWMDQRLCIRKVTAGLLDCLWQQRMHGLDGLSRVLSMVQRKQRLLIE